MDTSDLIGLGFVFGLFCLMWLATKAIIALGKKRTDTKLWALVFEGMTQGAISQEPLKEPEIFIEKKARRDGQDRDPESAKDI